ncbi:MAG: hypothetical protein EOO38_04900 [Cytophagaceae bacterium]|nr:MAG: hypothetical protein EOO38_04900 [Cytophagaceae bacterium]
MKTKQRIQNMGRQQAMNKCKRCLNLSRTRVGDRHVHGWLESDPTGTLQNTMESVQMSWICLHCATRWLRLKMKLSGSVRWIEVEAEAVQPETSTSFVSNPFSGLIQ